MVKVFVTGFLLLTPLSCCAHQANPFFISVLVLKGVNRTGIGSTTVAGIPRSTASRNLSEKGTDDKGQTNDERATRRTRTRRTIAQHHARRVTSSSFLQ